MTVEIRPVEGLPEVRPGDDLAALLEAPLRRLAAREDDVVAVTQKVVSKAEGRLVPTAERDASIRRESREVVARRGDLLIVRTRHGLVCATAGVDASNVPEGLLTLLPEDPDASAERLRTELSERLDAALAVVVTDTFGRPWREGVVDVAIGCAGLAPLVDLRGTPDDRGRALETTVVALADAVAAASGLVMTKTARVPAALLRGVERSPGGAPPGPAGAIVRSAEEDLFRTSVLEAVAAARPVPSFDTAPVSVDAIEEAVRASAAAHEGLLLVAATSAAGARRIRGAVGDVPAGASAFVVACIPPETAGTLASGLLAGAATRSLGIALHARGLAWWWDPDRPVEAERVAAALDLEPGWSPVALVAVGAPPRGGA